MKALIVIPARYNSKRFPGKPLALINGLPMLLRVYLIAKYAAPNARVIVATDDVRIVEFSNKHNLEVCLILDQCCNGTERSSYALKHIKEPVDYIINLQGDAVLTPHWVITDLLNCANLHNPEMITAATRMSISAQEKLKQAKKNGQIGGTTVVFDKKNTALYFSKAIIPYTRDLSEEPVIWRHIGIYGYRPNILAEISDLDPGPLERSEQLEQLRALEHGIPIRIVPVEYNGRTHWGVDTVEDLIECENIIDREGELLDFRKLLHDHTL